jgi:bifunctional non-homologous end joining protein LigD
LKGKFTDGRHRPEAGGRALGNVAHHLKPMNQVPMPQMVEPMLARLAGELPAGAGWAFEHKWDGYRALLYADRGRLRLLSRRHSDYTSRVPELAPLAPEVDSRRLILDGELVALIAGGRPSFQALQLRLGPQLGLKPSGEPPRSALAYLIFDLLYLDGRSLLPLPYIERRVHLEGLGLTGPSWWTPPYQLDGRMMLEETQTLGLEGVVAKKLASPYRPGARNGDWLKVKVLHTQPFVIAGWMPSDVRPDRIGSLVLATYDITAKEAAKVSRHPRLVYAGRVGTGFNRRTLELLQQILLPRRVLHNPLDEDGPPVGAHFVRPELVCEVTFREWTLGGEIRHPSFQRLCTDIDPTDVTRQD